MTGLLDVRSVSKHFGGVNAADQVSFSLAEGEHLAVIGPNGAGKSTLFKTIGGQLRPDSGAIEFSGQDITRLGARAVWRAGLAQTFQITATFASFTVIENVQLALMSLYGETLNLWASAHSRYREEAMELLKKTDISGQAERPCAVLAYGDLKRVELAIALAAKPRLLMLDEPTAGMAPGGRRDLMDLVTETARRENVSILFTEHDMDIVFGHAERILVLDQGRVIAQGDPEDVRANKIVQNIYLGPGAEV